MKKEKKKEEYIEQKIKEYEKAGFSKKEAVNKAHQSWRTFIGNQIQREIYLYLKEKLQKTGLHLTTDTELRRKNLPPILEMVKRKISINYGKYLFLPDADIIIYRPENTKDVRIIAIISVKNSFRERGFETTYWKKKLTESEITRHIKVFLVTPDKDDEISFRERKGTPRKMRVILEYELDGIYFLKKKFQKSQKVKFIEEIIKDIKRLCR